jgi:hypothetical protein
MRRKRRLAECLAAVRFEPKSDLSLGGSAASGFAAFLAIAALIGDRNVGWFCVIL